MIIQTDPFPLTPFASQVEYWKRFGFSLAMVEVSGRILWHLQYLQSRFRATRVRDLGMIIEAHLWYLLSAPTIMDAMLREFTPHYLARRGATPMPSDAFLQHLSFDNALAWTFPFGSFGYNFSLMEKQAEYLHPSQMVWIAFARILAAVPGPASTTAALKMKGDTEKDDIGVATFADQLMQELVPLALLRFLRDWTAELFTTELDSSPPGLALQRVKKALFNCGVDESLFVDAPFKFLHLDIGSDFFEATEALINERKRWEYVPTNDGSVLDTLAGQFFFTIDQTLPFDHFLLHRADMLIRLPPGGFNEIFVATAAMLLNRVLILLSPTDQERRIDVMEQDEFTRIRGLMFLAGQTLRRTNIFHWQVLGLNLVRLVMLPTDYLGETREIRDV